ncbi:MAG: hypothetical protein PHQ32_03365 [Firmicutes bacterium]|nr:hypothetical protein [Bacillota bacterium]
MKFFEKYLRNNDSNGSTLISVLVVTTILSLFLVTLQPIMFNYAQGSINENNMKQADFSARSANDAIVSKIIAKDGALIAGINSIANDGSSLTLNNFTFTKSGMGNIEAKILRMASDKFSVVTRATVNGEQRTITREITKTTTPGNPVGTPLNSYYFYTINFTSGGGFVTTNNIPVVVASSLNLNGGLVDILGDLYIMPSGDTFRGNSILNVGGNLYIGDGAFDISGSAKLYLKGTEYTKSNSAITRNVSTTNIKYCPDIYTTTTALTNTYNATPSWVRSTGEPYVNNMTFQGGTYYTMTGTRTITNIMSQLSSTVTPANPVYIILKSGARLTLTNAIDPPIGGVANDPRIVFILEGTAYVYLENQTSAVVYGTISTRLYVNNASNGTSTLYGQVKVGRMYHDTTNPIILDYKAATSAGTDSWIVGMYTSSSY